MPKWIHDRAEHILDNNPDMDESQAWAIATNQYKSLPKTKLSSLTTSIKAGNTVGLKPPTIPSTIASKPKPLKPYSMPVSNFGSPPQINPNPVAVKSSNPLSDPLQLHKESSKESLMISKLAGKLPLRDLISAVIDESRSKLAAAEDPKDKKEDSEEEKTKKLLAYEKKEHGGKIPTVKEEEEEKEKMSTVINFRDPNEVEKLASALDFLTEKLAGDPAPGAEVLPVSSAVSGEQSQKKDGSSKHKIPMDPGTEKAVAQGPVSNAMETNEKKASLVKESISDKLKARVAGARAAQAHAFRRLGHEAAYDELKKRMHENYAKVKNKTPYSVIQALERGGSDLGHKMPSERVIDKIREKATRRSNKAVAIPAAVLGTAVVARHLYKKHKAKKELEKTSFEVPLEDSPVGSAAISSIPGLVAPSAVVGYAQLAHAAALRARLAQLRGEDVGVGALKGAGSEIAASILGLAPGAATSNPVLARVGVTAADAVLKSHYAKKIRDQKQLLAQQSLAGASQPPSALPATVEAPKTASLAYVLNKLSESQQGGLTLDSASGEGPKPPSGSAGGNDVRRFLESSSAAVGMKKREAKGPIKRQLSEVLTEPAMSAATDSKVQDNLRNAAAGGVKIAAMRLLQNMRNNTPVE